METYTYTIMMADGQLIFVRATSEMEAYAEVREYATEGD